MPFGLYTASTVAITDGLRRHAMAVDVAYDGDAALERLAVNDYDVLVLDRDLPGCPATRSVPRWWNREPTPGS